MASDDDTKETKIGKGKCLKIIQPKEEFILVLFSETCTPELANVRPTFVISYKGKEVWSREIPFPELRRRTYKQACLKRIIDAAASRSGLSWLPRRLALYRPKPFPAFWRFPV